MNWDIVLFKSSQEIKIVEALDETQLEPTDFCAVLEKHFNRIIKDDHHREIKGADFTIDYFADDEKVTNKILSLYGENALYEIVLLARKHNWQIFDTGLGQMINLKKPSTNGYKNFQNYLKQILNNQQKDEADPRK